MDEQKRADAGAVGESLPTGHLNLATHCPDFLAIGGGSRLCSRCSLKTSRRHSGGSCGDSQPLPSSNGVSQPIHNLSEGLPRPNKNRGLLTQTYKQQGGRSPRKRQGEQGRDKRGPGRGRDTGVVEALGPIVRAGQGLYKIKL